MASPSVTDPLLLSWAIVRITPRENSSHALYCLTGVGFGHPKLRNGVQFLTTDLQELSEQCDWARSRSRIYRLGDPLEQKEFTEELADELAEMIWQGYQIAVEIAWVSVEGWRDIRGRATMS